MINKILSLFLLPLFSVYTQQIDSKKDQLIRDMESKIDSLCKVTAKLESEIEQINDTMIEGKTGIDELMALLNEEAVETVSAEQRSRHKRIDALLEAITHRPGKLRFNGGATATLHSGSNVDSRHASGVGSFDIYAHTSFGSNAILFFDLEAIGGNGPDGIYETFSGFNDDAGSTQDEDGTDRLTILEAWTEFSFLNKVVTITAGKIDMTNYFDNNASANDETLQFISSAFVNSSAFVVPVNGPGIRLRTTIFNRIYLQAGFSSIDNSAKKLFEEIYKIGGVSYKLAPGTDFESNLRFYGFKHPWISKDIGWGISIDNVLFGKYNAFVRYGKNPSGLANLQGIKSAWSAGSRFVTKLTGHTTVLGLAFAESKPALSDLKTEKLLEIYSRYQLNKWVHISAHLQSVWNANGLSNEYTILSGRTHFNF